MWPSNPITGHIPREIYNLKVHMHTSTHCSTIFNSQDIEITYRSNDRQMDEEDVIPLYNRILLNHKKEWNWVIWKDVDGSRVCHTEWSKSEREKQISDINTYMWHVDKWYRWTYFEGRERDTYVENRYVHTRGEVEIGTNYDIMIDIYTTPCVK